MADIDKNKYIGSFSLNQKVSLKTYNCNKLNVFLFPIICSETNYKFA